LLPINKCTKAVFSILLFNVNIRKKRVYFSHFSHFFALASGVKFFEISMKMSL
jgi:hypothetical protein